MSKKTVKQTCRPADWVRMIDEIDDALARAASDAARHAQELVLEPIEARGEVDPVESRLPDSIKLARGFETCLADVQRQAAEFDLALKNRERAAREWLEAAASLRRSLAEWTAQSIR